MNKIQRSRTNRKLSGVCGGVGEYFNIDPTIIRIVYVLFGWKYFGTAVIVYIICSIVIPEDDGIIYSDEEKNVQNEKIRKNTPLLIGAGLIIWGSFQLASLLIPWFNLKIMQMWKLWPVLLILLGIYILFDQGRKY